MFSMGLSEEMARDERWTPYDLYQQYLCSSHWYNVTDILCINCQGHCERQAWRRDVTLSDVAEGGKFAGKLRGSRSDYNWLFRFTPVVSICPIKDWINHWHEHLCGKVKETYLILSHLASYLIIPYILLYHTLSHHAVYLIVSHFLISSRPFLLRFSYFIILSYLESFI